MTDGEKKVLFEYCRGRLSREEFLRQFPNDFNSKDYVVNAIENAISKGDIDELDCTISLIWLCGKEKDFVDILNELLINPNHRRHQEITKSIQDIGNPSSVPFIKKVLQSNFDYLQYTCSDSDAIAKWFSWALYSIGTKEAIELMKEYSQSQDDGIRNEMIYRLKKVKM
jgi:HEAT repeat protein